MPLEGALGLISVGAWLWDLVIACRTKVSFKDTRRLSECPIQVYISL
jgi:hypothetical protein